MKKTFAKKIFTFILLIIFVSAPMASYAKSDKSAAIEKKDAVEKSDKNDRKAEKEIKNREKAAKKGTRWIASVSKNLDSIEKSLQSITLRIDKFTGTTTTGSGLTTTGSAINTSGSAINTSGSAILAPTTSGSGIDTTSGSGIETTSSSSIQVPSSTTTSAITDESMPDEQEEINSGDDDDKKISVNGFVNGNKGKLKALTNRLQAVKKQLSKVSQEAAAAVLSRIEVITANIAEQLQRLNSITTQPVPSGTSSVPASQTPEQTSSPSAIQISAN